MLLSVENLRIAFRIDGRISVPVRGVSFGIPENGRVALVGESGCGKSLTALALGGLVDRAEITGRITGSPRIAYVFQNPMQSLNPVMRVGKQIEEGLREGKVGELLEGVGLPASAERKYPCELSGGQQQRVMIAMAQLPVAVCRMSATMAKPSVRFLLRLDCRTGASASIRAR